MYFGVYITARVHQMIMQEWHAATTMHSYTLMSQSLTDLQTFAGPAAMVRSVRPWPYLLLREKKMASLGF